MYDILINVRRHFQFSNSQLNHNLLQNRVASKTVYILSNIILQLNCIPGMYLYLIDSVGFSCNIDPQNQGQSPKFVGSVYQLNHKELSYN